MILVDTAPLVALCGDPTDGLHATAARDLHRLRRMPLVVCAPVLGAEGFIRPVYWSKPMPPAPDELGHLHFRFVPLQDGATD